MKTFLLNTLGAVVVLLCATATVASAADNQLTTAEKKAGWKLLFDGQSLNGWRSYRKPEAPKQGWVIENGCLHLVPNSRPGDIITVEQFDDYEFRWEWRVATNGNNGIKYLVSETRSAPGPEYQMVDNTTAPLAKHQTAALYDILPATKNAARPAGEWNQSRLIVQGKHVEHWLNGKKVLEYELESPALKTAIAESKFRNVAGYDHKIRGHILLTDHKDEAFYRNLKLRVVPPLSKSQTASR